MSKNMWLLVSWGATILALSGAYIADAGSVGLGMKVSILGVVLIFWAQGKWEKLKELEHEQDH